MREVIVKYLTDKQAKIYDFICKCQRENGFPPTQAEICNHFKFASLNAVRSHLVLIEKKGYIRLNFGKARSIKLSQSPESHIHQAENFIPLLGRIAAGVPIWAEQNFEDSLPIPQSIFGGRELFALHVSGDSMIGAGIRNGDIAVIKKQDRVEKGEIAAVLIDQEVTLKRVFLSADSLLLKSENPDFEDLKYSKNNSAFIRILGRYQGIVRTMNNRRYCV